MKRILVVFGVLAVFLFATFGAQAVENNTWGRIKATFSEDNPDLAAIQSDGAHLLDPASETEDSEAPLAKPASDPAPTEESSTTEKGKKDPAPTEEEEEEEDRAPTKKKRPSRYGLRSR